MAMLNMSIPLSARLANRKADKAYRNDAYGQYTQQPQLGWSGVYYVEAGALRKVGYCDELARGIRHTGWFTDDDFQEDTMRGIVYALPAKNGQRRLVAGYHFNLGDDTGATLYFDMIYDDEIEAAHMADEHARVAAEREREFQAEEREKQRLEDAEEARLDNLADCHPMTHVQQY